MIHSHLFKEIGRKLELEIRQIRAKLDDEKAAKEVAAGPRCRARINRLAGVGVSPAFFPFSGSSCARGRRVTSSPASEPNLRGCVYAQRRQIQRRSVVNALHGWNSNGSLQAPRFAELMSERYFMIPTETKIKLEFPITSGGALIQEITMRRAKVKDEVVAQKAEKDPAEREVLLIANLCNLAPSDIGDLDCSDYARLQDTLKGFVSPKRKDPHRTAVVLLDCVAGSAQLPVVGDRTWTGSAEQQETLARLYETSSCMGRARELIWLSMDFPSF